MTTTARYALDTFGLTEGWDYGDLTPEQIDQMESDYAAIIAEEIGAAFGFEVIYHMGWTAQSVMSFDRGVWAEEGDDYEQEAIDAIITAIADGSRGRNYWPVAPRDA